MDFRTIKNLNILTENMNNPPKSKPIGWVDLCMKNLAPEDVTELFDFLGKYSIESPRLPTSTYDALDGFMDEYNIENDFLSIGVNSIDGGIEYALSPENDNIDFDILENMSLDEFKYYWVELHTAVNIFK